MVLIMDANQAEIGSPTLGDVRVRLVHGMEEQHRWDRLVATHHDLGFKGFYGRVLRHVAGLAGAFKVRLGKS